MSVRRNATHLTLVHIVAMGAHGGDALAVSEHLQWMRSAGRSTGTMSDRVGLLLRLARWLAEQDPPKQLLTATEDDLAAWQRSIAWMAPESISTYVGHCRGFYSWLAKFHHTSDQTGLLTRPRKPKHLPRPMPDDSLCVALRAADGPVLAAMLLMAFCGLRPAEVAGLQRRDIRDTARPPIIVVEGKGGKTRVVRMPTGLAQQLRAAGLPPTGHVFIGRRGRPVTPNRLSQMLNEHIHQLGIVETAYSLRHWYGTHTYQCTQDLRLVQEMMGHSSPTTTAVYTRYSPASAEKMADDLDKTMRELLGRAALRAVGPGG